MSSNFTELEQPNGTRAVKVYLNFPSIGGHGEKLTEV